MSDDIILLLSCLSQHHEKKIALNNSCLKVMEGMAYFSFALSGLGTLLNMIVLKGKPIGVVYKIV